MAKWIPFRSACGACLLLVAPLAPVLGVAVLACGPPTPTVTSRPSLPASPASSPAAQVSDSPDAGSDGATEAPSPFHLAFRGASIARVGATVAVFSSQVFGILQGTRLLVDRRMNAELTGCGSWGASPPTIEAVLGEDADKPLVVTAVSDSRGGTTRRLSSWNGKQWRSLASGDGHTSYQVRGGFILSAARYQAIWSYGLRSPGGAHFKPAKSPRCEGSDFLQAEDLFLDGRGGVLVVGGDPCEPSKGFGVERFTSKGGRSAIQWFGVVPQSMNHAYAMSDPDTLWDIAEDEGLIKLDLKLGSWKRMAGPSAEPIWDFSIAGSVMWIGAGEKVLRGRDGADWEELRLPRGFHPTRLVASGDGGVWVAAQGEVLTTVSGVPETTFPATCP
ncbi:hypothetical protein A7982_13992 [Minicystis rosea]|nr:hypothetical protein A7982_13992 [Minicystis rosea]